MGRLTACLFMQATPAARIDACSGEFERVVISQTVPDPRRPILGETTPFRCQKSILPFRRRFLVEARRTLPGVTSWFLSGMWARRGAGGIAPRPVGRGVGKPPGR